MRKYVCLFTFLLLLIAASGCSGAGTSAQTEKGTAANGAAAQNQVKSGQVSNGGEKNNKNTVEAQNSGVNNEGTDHTMKPIKVKITTGNHQMMAVFEDNVTSRELVRRMPFTVPMEDLYNREMCYHYGAGALPTASLRDDGYAVGDIIYWPPKGSFVILYAQNGERFQRQQIGHIDSGAEIFQHTGNADVTFELAE